MEQFLNSFLQTGSVIEAIHAINMCASEGWPNIASELSVYFPFQNSTLLYELAECSYKAGKYEEAFSIYNRILKMPSITEDVAIRVRRAKSLCVDHISDRFIEYDREKVQKILNRPKKAIPMITLTITTCKRYELFEKTMNSFINACEDLDLIDEWLCVDDNSSEEDRTKMREKYPFFEFYFKGIGEKGHPQSMNIIKRKVKTPFIFHMEDDWKFFEKRPFISMCMDVIQDPQIGQCLINRNYGEVSRDVFVPGGFYRYTEGGTRFYIHEYCPDDNAYKIFYGKYGQCLNSAYWPHFSFRPSLMKRSILEKLGEFDEKVSHFEMAYSRKYSQAGYVSAFLEGIYCLHTGRLTSEKNDETKLNAYILNNEKQFSGKEESQEIKEEREPILEKRERTMIKTFVVNMDRRTDRWEAFCRQKEPEFLKYNRFSAVDGMKMIPTEQLQRIFDNNDYNMRKGMVGCAMSHIKLCVDLVNSQMDVFCILEDDVTFVPDFEKKFYHLLSVLPPNWDICYLSYHLWKPYRLDNFYDKNALPRAGKWDAKTSLKYSMGGTGGYLITRKGAKALLDFINETGMTNGIDTVQQKSADRLNVYYAKPQLVYSECWTPETNPDTDIQHDFTSLTIPIPIRLESEKKYYEKLGKVVFFTSEKDLESYITNRDMKDVAIYEGEVTKEMEKKCVHPAYTLNYKAMIIVPSPTEKILEEKYFERIKKNGKYNVDGAILFLSTPETVISLGTVTHVNEAIKSITKDTEIYPFDLMDDETLPTVFYLLEKCLKLSEVEFKTFLREFFDVSKNETYPGYAGKIIFRNKETKISFPHDDFSTLQNVYFERFNKLKEKIMLKNRLKFIFATRWETNPIQEYTRLLDLIFTYNPNVKFLVINGIDKSSVIDAKYRGKICVGYVDFPEALRVEGWPDEKIIFDQKSFRLNIIPTIRSFISL